MTSGTQRARYRYPRTFRPLEREGRTARPDAKAIPALSMLTANLAAVFTAIGAFTAFIGSSYYFALFTQFGLQPSVLEISQAERMSIGVLAAFAALSPALGWWPIVFHGLLGGIIIGSLIIGLLAVGLRRRWAWCSTVRHWCRTSPRADQTNAWSVRTMVIGIAIALGLTAGTLTGDHDAKAYRLRIREGLGCDYRFGPETVHGVLLGQDHTRTLIITAAGVRMFENQALVLVGPTATHCLDRFPPTTGGS